MDKEEYQNSQKLYTYLKNAEDEYKKVSFINFKKGKILEKI